MEEPRRTDTCLSIKKYSKEKEISFLEQLKFCLIVRFKLSQVRRKRFLKIHKWHISWYCEVLYGIACYTALVLYNTAWSSVALQKSWATCVTLVDWVEWKCCLQSYSGILWHEEILTELEYCKTEAIWKFSLLQDVHGISLLEGGCIYLYHEPFM